MPLSTYLLLVTAVTATALGAASPTNGDARLHHLYGQFIAPCCWTQNLLEHHSPQAEDVRARIRHMVDDGKSDEQIKATLIEQYSLRILALPEGARAQWLWWTPIAAALAGIAAIIFALRRLRVPSSGATALDPAPLPDFDADWEYPEPDPDQHPSLMSPRGAK